MGRQGLGTLSIKMSVRRLECRSSFTNLKLAATETFQSQGFYMDKLPDSPGLGAFYNHRTLPYRPLFSGLVVFSPFVWYFLPPYFYLRRYASPFASKTSS